MPIISSFNVKKCDPGFSFDGFAEKVQSKKRVDGCGRAENEGNGSAVLPSYETSSIRPYFGCGGTKLV